MQFNELDLNNNEYISDVNSLCLAFTFRKANRAITQIYDQSFSELNLRSTQFNILVAFNQDSSITLSKVAEKLLMDRTTLTRNIKPLIKNGYIELSEAVDKRSKIYKLTDLGLNLVEKAVPIWRSTQIRLINVIKEDFAKDLKNNIDDFINKIDEY